MTNFYQNSILSLNIKDSIKDVTCIRKAKIIKLSCLQIPSASIVQQLRELPATVQNSLETQTKITGKLEADNNIGAPAVTQPQGHNINANIWQIFGTRQTSRKTVLLVWIQVGTNINLYFVRVNPCFGSIKFRCQVVVKLLKDY